MTTGVLRHCEWRSTKYGLAFGHRCAQEITTPNFVLQPIFRPRHLAQAKPQIAAQAVTNDEAHFAQAVRAARIFESATRAMHPSALKISQFQRSWHAQLRNFPQALANSLVNAAKI